MNPALPLVLLLSLAGLLWRRSEAGGALALCGLGVALLFAGPLLLHDGIPSPAASLAQTPPWRGIADPQDGNPILQDVSYQVYPWLLHLRRELRAGRWPFWNPHQFAGMTFWGNGQSAPLFPLHLLFAALPLGVGFALLPWLRLVGGGLGTYFLARELGASSSGARVAAVVYPLSGMLVSFSLFPMGNALALVPWVLLATERIASGCGGWPALALVVGLQLLAGHPGTAVHTALLAGLYLAVRGPAASPRGTAWRRFAAGWAVGGLAASVQLVPLALTLLDSNRWLQPPGPAPPFAQLLPLPLRLVLPDLWGNPALGTWWGPFNHLATAVYAGALALPLAALGIAAARRDRRVAALAALLVFSLWAAYHLPGLRTALSLAPIVGRALHHRLLFGVELALALLAAIGVDRWQQGRARVALAGAGATLGMLALAAALYRGEWLRRGMLESELRWTAWVAALVVLFAATLLLDAEARARLLPLVPLVFVVDLVLAHRAINPAQRLAKLYPPTGATDFLAGRGERVAGLGSALRPNAALVYGLYDVRGDDPLKSQRYEALYGSRLGETHPSFFRPLRRWRDPWLDRLGVRWVVAGPDAKPRDASWRLAYQGRDGRVFERPEVPALVRWSDGGAEGLRLLRRQPGRWEIEIEAPRRREVIVAEVWSPGWRAEMSGREMPVEVGEEALLAIAVAPTRGTLRLRYRPPGFAAGAAASTLGVLLLAAGAWRWR